MEANSNFVCPRCHRTLQPSNELSGTVWVCDDCNGRAVGLSLLHQAFTQESTNLLWINAIDGNGIAVCVCPACGQLMQEVNAAADLRVDVCCRCQFVWLDMGEVEKFAKRPPPTRPANLPEGAQEILGKALVKQVSEKAEAEALAESLRNHVMYAAMGGPCRGSVIDYLLGLLSHLQVK